ncbi:Uncharacterized protein FWK35_00019629 [Aphis craccivora]|uniref:Uncharacterized protein n=1 Tax=Aphis craccivora TaxID=307492 RepID=A0A6G0Y7F7_APHCR|nr:Uncharacterized protein FWK35_00019629 [Aphis craccivora]
MTEKREFLRKTSFRPNRFFYMVVIQKLISVNAKHFHQIFMSVALSIYSVYRSNFYEICRKCEKLQYKSLAFSLPIYLFILKILYKLKILAYNR